MRCVVQDAAWPKPGRRLPHNQGFRQEKVSVLAGISWISQGYCNPSISEADRHHRVSSNSRETSGAVRGGCLPTRNSPVNAPAKQSPHKRKVMITLDTKREPMDITVLRSATAQDHRAAESAMPIMDEGLTQQTYVRTLLRLHGVVCGWESLCEDSAPAWMLPMMKLRERASLLTEDLRHLSPGFTCDPPPELPVIVTGADFLGSMYVMEGSRLGGTFIAKHVEKALSLGGRGNAYFRGAGPNTGHLWNEFLLVLRTQVPENHTQAVVASAQRMFRFFAAWMQNALPIPEKQ